MNNFDIKLEQSKQIEIQKLSTPTINVGVEPANEIDFTLEPLNEVNIQVEHIPSINIILTLPGSGGIAGPQGPKGEDGYTPIKGIDYFDGEPGPQGPPGPQGEPGKDGTGGSGGGGMFAFEIIDGDLILMYPDEDTAPNFKIDINGDLIYTI